MNNNKTCEYCGKSINDYFKVCPYCSKKIDDRICKSCGKLIKNEFEICPYCGHKEIEWEISDKNGFICLLSAIFLFPFAIHRFYTGKKLTASILIILNIIFFIFSYIALPEILFLLNSRLIIKMHGYLYFIEGYESIADIPYYLVMIWQLVDIIMIVTGKFKDSKGKYIKLNS